MSYTVPAAHLPAKATRPRASAFVAVVAAALACLCATGAARGQGFERELDASAGVELRVKNRAGRVTVTASDEGRKKVSIRASSAGSPVTERDVRVEQGAGGVRIDVEREQERAGGADSEGKFRGSLLARERERIDLTVIVPPRARVRVETEAGAVDVVGNVSSAEVKTGTGTIRADVPLDALRYSFRWTLSRPRFFSEVELPEVESRRGGVYEISGRFGEKKAKREERIELKLETERGVVLFGVKDEAAVPSDLRERALTEAARAIIRSGDSELTDAIRKMAPRLVGDYTATLPPHASEPTLGTRAASPFEVKTSAGQNLARVQARVTDRNGRALPGLTASDFAVVEDGVGRAVREVAPSTAPFDLVLLLDVSGSVEERLDFIRKAALNFAEAAGAEDRIAIVSFRDDVQLVSDFTADRGLLAKRIKDIQAGGATALYDAVAYTIVHTLRPVRGGRTGVVILSDGDDNRSFVTFPSVIEAVTESGAIVYPLYVPSGLIPSSSAPPPTATLDPMRSRYLTLTSRAGEEGSRLAEVSGGTYYPITRIEQLRKAYDDVVAQLRTSYTITYETEAAARRDSRVRVRVNSRPDAAVRLSPAVGVAATSATP